mmetsp:Transcript_9596/g.29577  ORF Transcript_9596/g.29577 Transcript_9596/m.29577 type:complete len:230 (-) Transcript_9596:62-751(-)
MADPEVVVESDVASQEEVASVPAPKAYSARVYVGNLDYAVTSEMLGAHMAPAGTVVSAEVMKTFSGRSKGCGVVEFADTADAQKAINTLNDTRVIEDGRLIFVREDREDSSVPAGTFPARAPRGARGGARGGARSFGGEPAPAPTGENAGKQVFVGNLSYRATWQDLKDFFREAGEVVRADILMNRDRRSKGAGVVLFATEEGAQNAIASFNEVEFQGRPVYVKLDEFS